MKATILENETYQDFLNRNPEMSVNCENHLHFIMTASLRLNQVQIAARVNCPRCHMLREEVTIMEAKQAAREAESFIFADFKAYWC